MSGPLNADGHHWAIPLDQARGTGNLTAATVAAEAAPAAAEATQPTATQPDSEHQPERTPSRFLYPNPGEHGALAD